MKDWFLTLKRCRTIQWFLALPLLSPFTCSICLLLSRSDCLRLFPPSLIFLGKTFEIITHAGAEVVLTRVMYMTSTSPPPAHPLLHAVSVHFDRAHICMRVCINMEMELPLFVLYFPFFSSSLHVYVLLLRVRVHMILEWATQRNLFEVTVHFTEIFYQCVFSFFKGSTGSYIKQELKKKKNQKSLPLSL